MAQIDLEHGAAQIVEYAPIEHTVEHSAAAAPHISIKAEPLFEIMGFTVTNALLSSFAVVLLVLLGAYFYKRESAKKHKNLYYYAINAVLRGLYDLYSSVVEGKRDVFFPLLSSFFIYIILSNWFGLLPGVGSILLTVQDHGKEAHVPLLRGGTADLNTTLALGAISVFFVQYYGVKYLGWGGYLGKFINFTNPIHFFVGILEIISEFSKIVSFSFRLFGNIFAGEVLMTIISFLVPILVSFPFLLMEIFVGFIQALVFSMLSAVFLRMATAKH